MIAKYATMRATKMSNLDETGKPDGTSNDSQLVTWIAIGVALGAGLGAAFGNIALGIAIGVAIGVGIGAMLYAKKKSSK